MNTAATTAAYLTVADKSLPSTRPGIISRCFWIIKMLATTVGETGTDVVTFNLKFGPACRAHANGCCNGGVTVRRITATTDISGLDWMTVVLASIVATPIALGFYAFEPTALVACWPGDSMPLPFGCSHRGDVIWPMAASDGVRAVGPNAIVLVASVGLGAYLIIGRADTPKSEGEVMTGREPHR